MKKDEENNASQSLLDKYYDLIGKPYAFTQTYSTSFSDTPLHDYSNMKGLFYRVRDSLTGTLAGYGLSLHDMQITYEPQSYMNYGGYPVVRIDLTLTERSSSLNHALHFIVNLEDAVKRGVPYSRMEDYIHETLMQSVMLSFFGNAGSRPKLLDAMALAVEIRPDEPFQFLPYPADDNDFEI